MLIERRCFSYAIGHIGTLVDDVLALYRRDEVVIVFNELVVPVYPDDDRTRVLMRYDEKRLASIR